MKNILPLLFIVILMACNPSSDKVMIHEAYAFATPKTFPAAAFFMTIENNSAQDDSMIGFETDIAGRTELHTMVMDNDIMRMRQVEGYDISAGQTHILKPMADHVMIFDMVNDLNEGDILQGTAFFEKSDPITIQIHVKPRSEMMKHHH